MAVSTSRRPAAAAPVFFLTFLTALLSQRGVAEVPTGGSAAEELPHRRFEYKYSFKGPHLSRADGSVPFWIHTGSKLFGQMSASTSRCPTTGWTQTWQCGQDSWLLMSLGLQMTLFIHSRCKRVRAAAPCRGAQRCFIGNSRIRS